jgi:uncharacterized protein
MRLSVNDIKENEVLDTTVRLPAEEFRLDVPVDEPAVVHPVETTLHAEASAEAVVLTGQVATRLRITCSRCLEAYETPLTGRFEVHVSPLQEFVDVSEEVRQSLLLALPVKPLCRPDCQGICPQCGKNLNAETCLCRGEAQNGPFDQLRKFLK